MKPYNVYIRNSTVTAHLLIFARSVEDAERRALVRYAVPNTVVISITEI